MSRFPLLSIYQTLVIILAAIVVIVGVIGAFGAANLFGEGFNLGVFIVTLVPALAAAFGLGVVAELIQLFFEIADDLKNVREELRQIRANQTTSEKQISSAVKATRPQGATTETLVTARIKVKASSIAVREKPEAEAASTSQLSLGQTMTVYGKNAEGTWLSISRVGKLWIEAAGVDVIEGQVSLLTVMQPANP